jgi:hypothetical protein
MRDFILTYCPHCKKEVSNKAIMCHHCELPTAPEGMRQVLEDAKARETKQKEEIARRMNSSGSVTTIVDGVVSKHETPFIVPKQNRPK